MEPPAAEMAPVELPARAGTRLPVGEGLEVQCVVSVDDQRVTAPAPSAVATSSPPPHSAPPTTELATASRPGVCREKGAQVRPSGDDQPPGGAVASALPNATYPLAHGITVVIWTGALLKE